MSETENKVVCETPTPGKAPTRIPRWKYDAVAAAILHAVRQAGQKGLAFADLCDAVRVRLSPEDLAQLGSVSWHVTTVKLDLEAKGRVARVPTIQPQRLVLS